MSYIKESIKSELKSPINLIASIVTLINFIIPVARDKSSDSIEIANVNLDFKSIGLAFIVLVVFEAFLGNIFGKIIVYFETLGKGISRIMLFIVALISAWVSVFNVEWLITNTLKYHYGFSTGGFISFFCIIAIIIISLYLIAHHGNKLHNSNNYLNDFEAPFWLQGLAFLIMLMFNWIV